MHIVRRGFSLMEVLTVMLILSILIAIGIPQYFKTVERTRIAEVQRIFDTIKLAQQRRLLNAGAYTDDFDQLDVAIRDTNGVICGGAGSCPLEYYNITMIPNAGTNFIINANRNTATQRYGAYTVSLFSPADVISCNNANCTAELL